MPGWIRQNLLRVANNIPGLRQSRAIAHLHAELAECRRQLAAAQARVALFDHLLESATYNHDGLVTCHKSVGFLRDERFMSAYRTGVHSGHKFGDAMGTGEDIHIEWRVHVACWAAERARSLPGAFVECGVNTGIMSLAVCEYIDFNAIDKDFYLFDTFNGIPESQMAEGERTNRVGENLAMYEECFERSQNNFRPFPRARLVRGLVPDTLSTVSIDQVCYLSIDMNIVLPELAAMEFFWDKLVPGATVIIDDYGWANFKLQQEAHDRFAATKGVPILLLPTGQGVIIKP
jgi:O-methyltransferase